MFKYILSAIFASLMLLAGPVFAQDTGVHLLDEPSGLEDSDSLGFLSGESFNALAGMTPDNPLYFLDTWGENLSLFFTFSQEKKAAKRLKFAEEKLSEIDFLSKQDFSDSPEKMEKRINKAVTSYETHMDKLGNRLDNLPQDRIGAVSTHIAEHTDKHQDLLDRVKSNVPDASKDRLHNAGEKAKNNHLKALRHLADENPNQAGELLFAQAERRLKLAEESASIDPEETNRQIDRYKERIEAADKLSDQVSGQSGQDWVDFESLIQNRHNAHLDILERIRDKVPENARESIEVNIQRAHDQNDYVLERLEDRRGRLPLVTSELLEKSDLRPAKDFSDPSLFPLRKNSRRDSDLSDIENKKVFDQDRPGHVDDEDIERVQDSIEHRVSEQGEEAVGSRRLPLRETFGSEDLGKSDDFGGEDLGRESHLGGEDLY